MRNNSGLFGRLCAFFCVLSLSVAQAETIDIPAGTSLVFASNFTDTYMSTASGTPVTYATSNQYHVKGDDSTLAGNGYRTDWDDLKALYGAVINTNQSGSSASQAYAAIIDDPTSSGRGKVLHFRSLMTDSKTRGQVNTETDLNNWTSSVMMYVPSVSVGVLATYPQSMDWFTVAEFMFTPSFATADFGTCNSPPVYIQNDDCKPNFRAGLDIVKQGSTLVWEVYSDFAGKLLTDAQKAAAGVTGSPTNGLTQTEYIGSRSTEAVPLDEWFTLVFHYERYPNRTDGKGAIKVQVIDSANEATTIFDLVDVVVTDPLQTERQFARIKMNPMKMYTANYFVSYIFANNGVNPDTLDMYYDNWRLFSGDATVTDGTQTEVKYPKAPDSFTVVQNGNDIDISWTAPTQYTDDSAISGGTITGYDIRTGSSNGTGLTWTKFVDNQAGTTYSLTPPADGRYCYQAKARATAANGFWATDTCVDYVADPAPTGGSDPSLVDVYPFSAASTVTTLNMTLGAAIPEGDLIVLCTAVRRTEELTFGSSYGFTSIAQVIGTHNAAAERDPNLRCYYKIAGASEPTTYTVNTDGTSVEKIHGIIAHFSNPDPTTPIRDFDTIIANQATSAALPALSGGLSNSVALSVGAVWDNQGTTNTAAVPSGYTEEANFISLFSTFRFGIMLASVKSAADGTAVAANQTSAEASNHVGIHLLISGLEIDTTPDAFTLTDTTGHQSNSPLGALNGACTAAISGLAADTTISISGAIGAEYNIDGGTYGSTPGTVGNGDVVCVRLNASDLYDTDESVTLDIGGVFGSYTVTTLEQPPQSVEFNEENGRLKRGGSLYSGVFGNVKIYSELPWKDPNAILFAHATNVTATSGTLSISEADIESGGSIDALIAGTDYAFVAYDDDGDPFAFGYIQITVE